MLKSDLINILVAKRGVTQKQAEATIETIFESMKDALCRGENIEIRGLGAFHVKNYQGYQGRNPKTGQVIPVKPKRGLLFRTGKELRDRVNRPMQQQQAAAPSNPLDPSSSSGGATGSGPTGTGTTG
jgi:integration host factor subunit beta